MDATNKKRLLLLITNGYAATNIIHSGLIRKLATEYDVYVLSDIIDEEVKSIINRNFNIHIHRSNLRIYEEPVLLKIARRLEKLLFMSYFQVKTQQIKNGELPLLYRFLITTIHAFTSFRYLSAFLLRSLRTFIIQYPAINFLDPFHFDGVISTSPLDMRENMIVNDLKKRNVRSLAIVISWDNLTSKGVINSDHDCVLVWNSIMAKEYHRFYSVLSHHQARVEIAGIPRFDIYKRSEILHSDDHLFDYIPGSRLTILFATSAVKHFPNQVDILDHLMEYAVLRNNILILLRCHPGDDVSKYQKYKNHRLLEIETVKPITENSSVPDLNDLQRLAYLLRECTVCVQVASTIRLEAALCNKPVISIAYDGDAHLPEHLSVKRLYSYSHQLALNSLGIDQFAYSKTELFLHLDKLIIEKKEIDNREKLLDFIPQTKLPAMQTTMKYINQWLR